MDEDSINKIKKMVEIMNNLKEMNKEGFVKLVAFVVKDPEEDYDYSIIQVDKMIEGYENVLKEVEE